MNIKTRTSPLGIVCSVFAIGGFCLAASASGQTVIEFNDNGGDGQYTTAANWSSGGVPSLTGGNTAQINDGVAVTYTPGGDLAISSGSTLEITSGSWTQAGNINYIQLGQGGSGGNGTVLINGGTFNQGTDSATPFNITGTGNLFEITSGAANVTTSFQVGAGLAYLQTGGTVTSGEFDFNTTGITMTGGVLNTPTLTGVNSGGATAVFTLSGGTINLGQVYGGGTTRYVNFTVGSTGELVFNSTQGIGVAAVENYLSSGTIEYNGTVDAAAFSVTTSGSDTILSLVTAAVPEPSTYALLALGSVVLGLAWKRRSRPVTV